jgi:hypothetical protein
LVVLLLAASMAASYTIAQTPDAKRGAPAAGKKQAPPSEPTSPPAAVPAPEQPLPVSLEQALYLIRSTLLTLNDANRTGNYTVLHDLASPEFQARNTAADLSDSFADLRRRHFDLFSAAIAAPQLSVLPVLDGNGMLRLTGFFPTRPLQINFDLLFQNSGGQWRLFGISVATPQAQTQPQDAQQAQPPSSAPTSVPNTVPAAKKK